MRGAQTVNSHFPTLFAHTNVKLLKCINSYSKPAQKWRDHGCCGRHVLHIITGFSCFSWILQTQAKSLFIMYKIRQITVDSSEQHVCAIRSTSDQQLKRSRERFEAERSVELRCCKQTRLVLLRWSREGEMETRERPQSTLSIPVPIPQSQSINQHTNNIRCKLPLSECHGLLAGGNTPPLCCRIVVRDVSDSRSSRRWVADWWVTWNSKHHCPVYALWKLKM